MASGTHLLSLGEALLAFGGLTVITVITRGFFFLSERELRLPERVQRGLRYAPVAALAAVVLPEVLMRQGQWTAEPWREPQLWAALAAGLWFLLRGGLLGTIVVGMAVMLGLRLGLGLGG